MTTLKVAIIQAAPVPLAIGDGIDKAVRLAREAIEGEETLIADLDLVEIGQGLASLDTDGHYSRPDVFELHITTTSSEGVKWH